MSLSDAVLPALIADAAVLLSFLDGKVIDAKVASELATATNLNEHQRQRIAQMCNGASTLMAYLANMAILLATIVFGLSVVSKTARPWVLGTAALILLLLVIHLAHVVARTTLSEIDDRRLWWRLSLGMILRIELLVLNAAVFVEAALG